MNAKKLGFGFMRMPLLDPNDQTSIDVPQLEKMVDRFFEKGFTYCDTAWMYHNFMSEKTVGKAVVARYPRDSFTVATKMPLAMLNRPGEAEEIFEAQKKNLGVDYFDYYLLHNMTRKDYEVAKKYDVFSFVKKKVESGEIRSLGFSMHDTHDYLDQVLTDHPEFSFVQLQINYLDWESDRIQSRLNYEVCVEHGKDVIVMEPVKGGRLANLPDDVLELFKNAHPDWSPASWAIRFAASLPNVKIVLSGMSSWEQLVDNTACMENFEPLSEADQEILKKAADLILEKPVIDCTGCRYCIEESQCPKNIAIPDYFALFNKRERGTRADEQAARERYRELTGSGFGPASACISCKKCERVCPQNLPVASLIRKVRFALE
ncbi:MAG: aldo/keto reductase [Lachnospiraceae bacterium]|nr:aldo/keto reductase [Lachnospiraceae bacterium]